MISSHDLEKILTSVSLHQMTHQKNSSNSKCSGNFLAATPFFGMSKIQLNDLNFKVYSGVRGTFLRAGTCIV